MAKKISVITPIYNVEAFLEKCVTSLMKQTFEDVEYIFVNDASTDRSMDILQDTLCKYQHRDVKIIHHIENKGLPASRKTGFEAASGEYILNVDGDDWLDETMLEKLYDAVEGGAIDYAYCDFYLSYSTSERYMKCPAFGTPDEALRKGYLSGSAKYNVWNKLIRKSLYAGVEFPVNHRKGGEDMIMLGILSKAQSIAYVPKALYHYVKTNTNAISESFSEQRLIDIKHNADSAISLLEKNYPSDLTLEIALFKLNVKLPFLITDDKLKYEIWKEWYPEANKYALKNKYLPLRTRFLQLFAANDLWPLVRLYHKIIYILIYPVIYK